MKVNRITFTGLDDSTNLNEVASICKSYPFVEWGMLASKSNQGEWNRYPQKQTIRKIINSDIPTKNLALHIQGSYLKNILKGYANILESDELPYVRDNFHRAQLNFHRQGYKFEPSLFIPALKLLKCDQTILQMDAGKFSEEILQKFGNKFNFYPLYDASGGAGVIPNTWPKHNTGQNYFGYAGGLGPDNLAEQLDAMNEVTNLEDMIWIDMESRIRTDDEWLDLDKCEECIKILIDSGYLEIK